MCFSAEASFTATTLLSSIGYVSYKMARNKKEYLIALTPVLFALQQACEGILWLTIPNYTDTLYSRLSIYAFLLFALVIWPIWIPSSFYVAEENKIRKKIMKNLVAVGILTALILTVCLIKNGADIHIGTSHIEYRGVFPQAFLPLAIILILYLASTILPFFISSLPYMSIVGVILAISYGITYIFYRAALTSVWCFFAAIISGSVLLALYKKYHPKKTDR